MPRPWFSPGATMRALVQRGIAGVAGEHSRGQREVSMDPRFAIRFTTGEELSNSTSEECDVTLCAFLQSAVRVAAFDALVPGAERLGRKPGTSKASVQLCAARRRETFSKYSRAGCSHLAPGLLILCTCVASQSGGRPLKSAARHSHRHHLPPLGSGTCIHWPLAWCGAQGCLRATVPDRRTWPFDRRRSMRWVRPA
jgi:hypothetical protein